MPLLLSVCVRVCAHEKLLLDDLLISSCGFDRIRTDAFSEILGQSIVAD